MIHVEGVVRRAGDSYLSLPTDVPNNQEERTTRRIAPVRVVFDLMVQDKVESRQDKTRRIEAQTRIRKRSSASASDCPMGPIWNLSMRPVDSHKTPILSSSRKPEKMSCLW